MAIFGGPCDPLWQMFHVRITRSLPYYFQIILTSFLNRFFSQIQSLKLIKPIALDDLLIHLKTRELSLDDTLQLFKWYMSAPVQQQLFGKTRREATKMFLLSLNVKVPKQLLENKEPPPRGGEKNDLKGKEKEKEAELKGEETPKEWVCQNLGTIVYFISSKGMRHLPLPPTTLYHGISEHCSKALMKEQFGWQEMTFWDWWTYMKNSTPKQPATPKNPTNAPRNRTPFQSQTTPSLLETMICSEEHVVELLRYISQVFNTLSEPQKVEIVSFLAEIPCIPVEPAATSGAYQQVFDCINN